MNSNKQEYTTAELEKKFEVLGFGYGYVAVKDRITGEKGSFDFKNRPEGESGGYTRIYFDYNKA